MRPVQSVNYASVLTGSPAGGTADMAGLATCSTASKSSREEKVLRCCSTLLSHVPLIMHGCIAVLNGN